MRTGVESWKLAKGLYIVPILFAYTPILAGDWGQAVIIFAFAIIGIYALSASLQGCMEAPFGILPRLIALAAGIACLWPASYLVNAAGSVVVIGLLVWNVKTPRREPKTAAPL